jgi:hypothetical protein
MFAPPNRGHVVRSPRAHAPQTVMCPIEPGNYSVLSNANHGELLMSHVAHAPVVMTAAEEGGSAAIMSMQADNVQVILTPDAEQAEKEPAMSSVKQEPASGEN